MDQIISKLKTSNRNTLVGYSVILLVFIALCYGINTKKTREYQDAVEQYKTRSDMELKVNSMKVENAMKHIYEGLRTISRLPSIKTIDRHGTNLGGDSRSAVIQIYNNIAADFAVSEIYVVPVTIDPEKIDPVTGNLEVPILMFNSTAQSDPASSQTVKTVEDALHLDEVEIFEYRLLKDHMTYLKATYPTEKSVMGDLPMISGHEVITCDNTVYDKTKLDIDRKGIIFSVPFFDPSGNLKGTISAIIRTDVMQDLLPDSYYALSNAGDNYTILSKNTQDMEKAKECAAKNTPDDSLIYSNIYEIHTTDPRSKWSVWVGLPDELFLNSRDVIAIKNFKFYAYLAVIVLSIGATVVWSLLMHNFSRIMKLKELMIKLTNKELNVEIPYLDSHDAIGEMSKAVDALKKSSIDLQDYINHSEKMEKATSAYPVILCDSESKILFCNKAAEHILLKFQDDIKLNVTSIVGSDISGIGPELVVKTLAKGSDLKKEVKIGSETLEFWINPLYSENGEYEGLYLNFEVITERLKNESEILLAQSSLNEIIEAATKGILNKRIDVSQFDGFYKTLAIGMNKLMEIINVQFSNTRSVLEKICIGDLTESLTNKVSGEFKDTQDAINNTISIIRELIENIRTSTEVIQGSTTEISKGSNDLSERTEQQAHAVQTTNNAIKEINELLKRSAENSKKASEYSDNAESVATKGGEIVNKMSLSVIDIEKSSNKIGEIISVIDEIAFQTNLLSLNASVEAARAGEAGKGFAVVAGEVRALAARCSTASKEIKSLISESNSLVSYGSGLAKDAGVTLSEVVRSITEVNKLIQGISGASNDQVGKMDNINKAVLNMEEDLQQNAALAEENRAAIESLLNQARELNKIIETFKI